MTDAEELDWWSDQAHRRMDECQRLATERNRLRAELAEVRRLLLPHPDAKDGEEAACGCDLHTAATAAAWAAAELKRLRDELAALRAGGDRVQHTGGEK